MNQSYVRSILGITSNEALSSRVIVGQKKATGIAVKGSGGGRR
jgi:hypothetical protein